MDGHAVISFMTCLSFVQTFLLTHNIYLVLKSHFDPELYCHSTIINAVLPAIFIISLW